MQLHHIRFQFGQRLPYRFQFFCNSPVFAQRVGPGRPKHFCSAVCTGTTAQDAFDPKNPDRPRVRRDAAPNTSDRFPIASCFRTREEAALECDFWILVLRRKFFLNVPWSHGTEKDYIEAARSKGIEPYALLEDESKWCVELVDFIEQNSSKLWQHRDVYKPDLDLDDWMRVAIQKKNPPLKIWVDQVRELQRDIERFTDPDVYDRFSRSLRRVSFPNAPTPERGSPLRERILAVQRDIQEHARRTAALEATCVDLVLELTLEGRRLKAKLKQLLDNRPPLDLPIEQQSEYYQSDVS